LSIYQVIPTRRVKKEGHRLRISDSSRLWIIEELGDLTNWNDIQVQSRFDHGPFEGAIKFNFNKPLGDPSWIRVFVYRDDVNQAMWVFKVLSKRSNKITLLMRNSIRTALDQVKLAIYLKDYGSICDRTGLKLLKGGLNDID